MSVDADKYIFIRVPNPLPTPHFLLLHIPYHFPLMTGNTSSTMVALPTRKHRLPLDARNKIAETFTGKLVNLYTWSDGLPKNISTHIPVEIDWSDVCESLVGINCFPTAIEVIEPVCDAISTVLNEIIDRLRSKTTGPESWAQKFEAAKIREIRIGVISGEDVDVFVKQNVLHVELPKRYSTESIKVEKEWVKNVDQLKLPALWDRLFDIDETAEIERGERLPDASSLPKPEELLMCTAPYFISIHAHNDATVSGAVSIFIEGSHKPTLNLIYDYFRNNPQTSVWCSFLQALDNLLTYFLLGLEHRIR